MTEVLSWASDVFDPSIGYAGFERRLPDLLQAIKTHVREEHRIDTCYDRRIKDRELAVLLYVVERGSFDLRQPARQRWTLPRESVEAFASRLAADGVKCGKWPNRKFYAGRDILERAGLIYRLDNTHAALGSGRGVAHRFHIGRSHPLDPAFRDHCARTLPAVLTVSRNRYHLQQPFDGASTGIVVDIPATFIVSPENCGHRSQRHPNIETSSSREPLTVAC